MRHIRDAAPEVCRLVGFSRAALAFDKTRMVLFPVTGLRAKTINDQPNRHLPHPTHCVVSILK